ncbi:MAG: hypothetical protein AB8B55_00295 [Mariniblastus sp.]
MIRFRCHCGKKMKAEEEIIGRKVKCPRCDRVAIVPEEDNLERPVETDDVGDAFGEVDGLAQMGGDSDLQVDPADRNADQSSSFVAGAPSSRSSRLETNRPDFSSFGSQRDGKNSANEVEESNEPVINVLEERETETDSGEVIELFGHSAVVPKSGEPFEPSFKMAQPRKKQLSGRAWIPIALIIVALVGGTYFAVNINKGSVVLDSDFQKMPETQMYMQSALAIEKSNRFMLTSGKSLLFVAPSEELEENLDSYSASILSLTRDSTVLTDAEKLFKDGNKADAKKLLADASRALDERRLEVEAKLEEYRSQGN